ncbi:alpha/beta hydrolase [Oceanobacillus saliphilus]|uniref:alpha/beta hydrolase n=1 Tax=Oceanobacillus saliphilus TaxID=2925834 RepID=UPI00201E4155|nr:alpha/beta hydrolase [Oceanobacillus saliphilus]
MESSFWLTMEDHVEVYIKKWTNENRKPKAIIQLAHGMVEHINRYGAFANYLVEQGFDVFGNDHRGHGKTGERQGLQGYFADEDGFSTATNDLFEITNHVKENYPGIPIFLIGHSMGSFLARNYIQTHSESVQGVVLTGTGYYPKAVSLTGKSLAALLPPKEQSPIMNRLTFCRNNKKIKERKNGFEWLTRDETVVEDYIKDPFSGFIPTSRFFYDLLTGVMSMQNNKQNKSVRKNLPLLLLSGDADPIGNYAKGIWKTAKIYQKAGLENVTVMLFTDGRHELLNEINRDEIFKMLCKWLKSQLP